MQKSTIFLAVVCLTLAGGLTAVVGKLVAGGNARTIPAVAGTLNIGLPGGASVSAAAAMRARSAVVWDAETDVIVFEHNGFSRQPIASITKLVTAMVALDIGFDWESPATIEQAEYGIGGQLLLHPGENVTMRDLWQAMLLGSANNATLALVRELGVPEEEFVRAMNRKAIALGLEQTEFVDVTGLDPGNLSTAYEVARLTEAALADYPAIAETTAAIDYTFAVQGSGREHTIRNTNKLITDEGLRLAGGKTGYLDEAGFCLVAQGGEALGHRIAVVLGAGSEADSVQEVKNLLQLVHGRF